MLRKLDIVVILVKDWPEMIIEDAYLFNVTTGGGWGMTIIDEGNYYNCSHHVRDNYNFS